MRIITLFYLHVALLLCSPMAEAQHVADSLIHPISLSVVPVDGTGQQIPADTLLLSGTLPNGLEYYIYENHAMNSDGVASFGLVQKSGSIHETDDEQGMAHFLEHMLFQGTRHFPGDAIERYANSIGVRFGRDLNAITTFENVRFMLPEVRLGDNDERLDSCLLILRDWACDATIDEAEFDEERKIVLREHALHAMADGFEVCGLYANTPYANRYPVGKREKIESMTASQMRSFYHKWYQPQNQAVVVVGGLDRYKVLERVKHFFGSIPKGSTVIPSPRLDLTPGKGASVASFANKVQNAKIYIVYNRPSETDVRKLNSVQSYVEKSMEDEFAHLFRERISNICRNRPTMVSGDICIGHYININAMSSIAVSAECSPQSWSENLSELLKELERIRRYGWLKNEMGNYYGEICGDGLLSDSCLFHDPDMPCSSQSDNASLLDRLFDMSLNGTPVTSGGPGCYLSRYASKHMSQELIYSHIRRFMDSSRLSVVVSLPEGDAIPTNKVLSRICDKALKADVSDSRYANATYPVSALVRSVSISSEPGHIVSREITEQSYENSHIEYRDSLRAIRLSSADKKVVDMNMSMHPGETTKFVLSNGVTVITRESLLHSYRVKGFLNGGMSIFDDDEVKFVPLYKYAIRDVVPNSKLSSIRGDVTVSSWNSTMDFEYVNSLSSMHTLPDLDNIDDFFKYIHIKLTNSQVDERKFGEYKEVLRSKQNDAAPTLDRFNVLLNDLVFNNNCEAQPLTPDELKVCTADKVAELYRRLTSNYNGAVIIIESGFAANELAPYIEKYIASLPSRQEPMQAIDRQRYHYKSTDGSASYRVDGETPVAYLQVSFTQEKDFEYTLANALNIEAVQQVLSRLLYQRLRVDNKYVYSSDVFGQSTCAPWGDMYYIGVFTASEPSNSKIVADIIRQTMHDIAYGDALTEELVDEYKTDKRVVKWFSGVTSFAEEEYKRQLDGKNFNLKDPDAIDAVSVSSVRSFVQSLLQNGNVFDFEMTTQK